MGKFNYQRLEVQTKEKEDLIKREFLMVFFQPKGVKVFGLLWRIMLLDKRRRTNQLDYVALIINYFKKTRGRGEC